MTITSPMSCPNLTQPKQNNALKPAKKWNIWYPIESPMVKLKVLYTVSKSTMKLSKKAKQNEGTNMVYISNEKRMILLTDLELGLVNFCQRLQGSE